MASTIRLDNCLATRDVRLCVEGCDTITILECFRSPVFVLSGDPMQRHAAAGTVLVTGGQPAVIRRREIEEDVLHRDVMPEHLAG